MYLDVVDVRRPRVEVQVNVMRWEQRGVGECDAMGATRWDC